MRKNVPVPPTGYYGFDLKPYMIAAAKSRGIKNITEGAIALAPPKKRQFAACCLVFCLLPASMTLTAIWAFLSLSRPLLAVLLIMYATHIYRDTSHSDGSKTSKYWKEHWFWGYMKDYFPILLIKQNPDTVFDPKHVYMFGYHPHGIISVGCFVNFCSDANKTSELFPGINIHPATLTTNFAIPFWREIILRVGAISVSAFSLKNVLKKGPGNAVLVVPGGAAESLDAHPGTHSLTLKKRQGFFRIALQHGAALVPIYSFGENDLYEQAPNEEGTLLRIIQNKMLKIMGFAMPFFSGAGSNGGNMPMNPVPKRVPVITVVGDPIMCPLIPDPTREDIDKVRALYVQKLKEIFEQFADKYAPNRTSDFKVVH